MRLFKFYANWCGPCKVLSKKLEDFDVCDVVACNIEDESGESLVERYGIRSVPTLILVDDNEKVLKTWNGLVNIDKLKEEVREYL